MKSWSFAKYVGCGNDFILFDNRLGNFPLRRSLIQRLCQRQKGIGADGLILLENSTSQEADFRFRIFNSDGGEAEMCGNGMRCFVKWLASMGFQQEAYRIETMQSILIAEHIGQNICVEMGTPRNIQWDIPLRFENRFLRVHYLNTGVPHAVLFTDNIEEINLIKLGHYIRNYSLWMPQGTNVTVAQKKEDLRLKVRTYERGVEGETLACGTGAVAAALAAARQYQMNGPIYVENCLGEELLVEFAYENQKFLSVTLTGPAECSFEGKVDIEDVSKKIFFLIASNSVISVKCAQEALP